MSPDPQRPSLSLDLADCALTPAERVTPAAAHVFIRDGSFRGAAVEWWPDVILHVLRMGCSQTGDKEIEENVLNVFLPFGHTRVQETFAETYTR